MALSAGKVYNHMADYKEKKLESKEIFNGRIIDLTLDTVELENGKTSTREIVHHNGGAAIVAVNEKGEIALVRQYRYALRRQMIEIPAGKIELGETPRKTAIRELKEETGCIAEKIKDFGMVVPTCAYCTEVIYLFLATDLRITQQNLDDDEFLDVFWVPLNKAVDMVMQGEIDDSKAIAGILKLKQKLEDKK